MKINLRKILLKKSFWLAIIIIVVIIGVALKLTAKPKTEYVTEKVSKGMLRQTVSETGTVKAETEIDLNFKGSGTIVELNVKEGDTVNKGDILARLDAGNLEIQVKQAQANVDIAKANLSRILAGSSSQDINVSQESVNNAWTAYENAKKDHEALIKKLEADIKNYEEAVRIAETSLTDTGSTTDLAINNSRDNLLISMSSAISSADHALDIIDSIFTDFYLQKSFSVENKQYGISAEFSREQAGIKLTPARSAILTAQTNPTETNISQAYNLLKPALDETKLALDYTFLGLSASTTTFDFPETSLNAFKNSVKTEQTAINTAINTTSTNNQTWQNAKLSNTSSVNSASGNLETAKKNLNSALANKEVQIANSQAGVDNALGSYNLAKAQLELKKAPVRGVEANYYQAQIQQSQAALDLVVSNLEDYIIYAPSAGIVTFVNYNVGEQIGIGLTTAETKPVITLLGMGDYEIEVDIPESDIIKVSLGDAVEITLDAYGDEDVFQGKVYFIDLAETLIQDVVYYKVTLVFQPSDKEIKPGMTANADIITDQKEDVLIVPIRAVKETAEKQKYVEILKNGKAEHVNVTTGLRGDDGIEIISGLEEGQDVITYVKEQ